MMKYRPCIVQAAQRKEKGEDDDEQPTGPDPVEVKKRFNSLKRHFNKVEKACSKSRTTKKALQEQKSC
ncbi:MAG: hypothetical protein CM1200mP12_03990 [Gammaproteobacteria bacterium]|nr:MAG: hypothetical protein CM1200mP12_03990 [Gammaproteobacteria bacterium]